jgi:hypothetical protein
MLEMVVPNITVSDLLAVSLELQKEAVDHCRMHRVPVPTTAVSVNTLTLPSLHLRSNMPHLFMSSMLCSTESTQS